MFRTFRQPWMHPLYGISHYVAVSLFDMFFRGEVVGLENLPRTGGFLVAGNHASHLDPPFIGCQIESQMAFFARKRVLGALKNGRSVALFPEGTRSPDGSLQAPKAGVGLIACKTAATVIPVRIFNSHVAFGKGRPLCPGTPVSVRFGRPLSPADYDDPKAGKERYQVASERIMAAIAALKMPEPPAV
jgi:1-acyl-sn-glycerol-3-phosphate acyltransferase